MADSKEDIASQALARLGEPSIDDFDEDSDTAEKVRQLYEPTILSLLGRYQWDWASAKRVLQVDGAKTPENEWRLAYALPTPRLVMAGMPYRVYNSTAVGAGEVFDYEISGKHLLTNLDTIVVEFTERKAETLWPGYFEELAVEACAAKFALPITENASKETLHRETAFGTPSQNGEGGLFSVAMKADAMASPPRGLLDESDPIAEARFGSSRRSGWW